jgi:hypothetical protein
MGMMKWAKAHDLLDESEYNVSADLFDVKSWFMMVLGLWLLNFLKKAIWSAPKTTPAVHLSSTINSV